MKKHIKKHRKLRKCVRGIKTKCMYRNSNMCRYMYVAGRMIPFKGY